MKASSNFMSAVSAVALSAGLAVSGSFALQFATIAEVQAAVVRSIEVRGNTRVDDETIRSYIDIKPGRSFSPADIDEAVKRLFSTGLFSDVSINPVGSTLVVQVAEYQVVNQVLFQGNKKIKDEQLAARVQTQPRGPYSPSTLNVDVDTIKESYNRIGRSDAVVTTDIIDVGQNRVNVVFNIQEGGRTKIANIDFVGNNAYSDRRLRDVISTKRSTLLSFLMRDDVYDENKLRADEEALRRYYYNHGYADFRVISADAQLDESANEYTITFTIDEGERYTFGDIEVESTIPGVDAAQLKRAVETDQGDVYSAKNVEDSIIGLTEAVAGDGYAFAQVTPRGDRDFNNRKISVVYTVDQGPRAYVERIEIRGNDRTRDYVIRREFDLAEGDAFNQVLIKRAKRRLEDLNYFDSVNITTQQGSEADQVVIIVDVKEKSTGEFSIGGGYVTGGENPGPRVELSVAERNFLGRGQYIKFSAGGGKDSRDYAVSFTEPYFLGRRIAAGFDISRQTTKGDNYDTEVTSGTIRFGLPITNALTTQVAYNLSSERYTLAGKAITDCSPIVTAACKLPLATLDAINNSPWVKSSVSGALLYNTIDDMKNPHNGIFAKFDAEYAGLGGDAHFMKFTARTQYYRQLNDEMDLVGLVTAGAGHTIQSGNNPLRQFDLFKSSDRIIRGFAYNGIGPYQNLPSGGIEHVGGMTYFHGSAELQFPMPVLPESLGMRGAVFTDVATLYGVPTGTAYAGSLGTTSQWRASAGASIIWQSPFGPLRIDYAIPYLKQTGDVVENINFGISGRF
ncbi:outer membrane protein assembly factor BamA [Zhengella mangrovi]|uniref:Outer membrane protein assembly factor BamA n=1 Tax=Zhengella mangrovi TaxID=1982044 RepID=A0A2G1QS67_9HYPH|nr:outer membrane protein assembly factor BamA [Zhengella mangrovi]PHP68373.1 outer membrane protein assembly factor BamA [Zhengella mangrovi]